VSVSGGQEARGKVARESQSNKVNQKNQGRLRLRLALACLLVKVENHDQTNISVT
jgi:hypothetical protein